MHFVFVGMLNSLLALLNSRDHMRNKMLSDEVVSIQLAHVSQDRGIPSGDRSISGRNIQMDMDVFGSHKVSHDKVCNFRKIRYRFEPPTFIIGDCKQRIVRAC